MDRTVELVLKDVLHEANDKGCNLSVKRVEKEGYIIIEKYVGEWKNGMMDGYGEFIEYYEPEYFINRDGTAKPVNKYRGNFIKGKKEGKFEVYEHMGEHDEKPSDWTKQTFKNDY